MKKAILLIGPPRSGKSRLANLMVKGKKHVVLNGKSFKINDKFGFKYLQKDTEVIIIDDLKIKKHTIGSLYPLLSGINVNVQYAEPFIINPLIIITTDSITMDNLPIGASFEYRFDVFELSGCNECKIENI